MRPGAPMFSPKSRGGNAELSVVRHENLNRSSSSESDATPRDLLFHESLKALIQYVQELKERCSSLEHENGELKSSLEVVKRDIHAGPPTAGSYNGNLPGYASSESSSGEELAISVKSDMDKLNKDVDDRMGAVSEILKTFQDQIDLENEGRTALEKKLEQDRKNVTGIKGRTGALEAKLRSLDKKVEDIEVRLNDEFRGRERQRSEDRSAAYFRDRIETMQGSLDRTIATMLDLQDAVRTQSDSLVGPQTTTKESGEILAPEPSADISRQLPFLQANMDDLKNEISEIKRDEAVKAKQRQEIDNCAIREGLHHLYYQLTSDMDGETGHFVGDEDELWALRDRVLCRLALFDLYGKAVYEAKTADVAL